MFFFYHVLYIHAIWITLAITSFFGRYEFSTKDPLLNWLHLVHSWFVKLNWLQHVIVKHFAWFVAKYGSFALWSTQGMEKIHYAAKTAYVKYTQHFGINQRHFPIMQQFEWWYHTIQHREFQREKNTLQKECAIVDREQGDVRRQTLLLSTTIEKHRAWHTIRRKDGSRWVLVMHE